MIQIQIFSWIEIWILHWLHILDFQMLSWEIRNQSKKNDIVSLNVRTFGT